MKDDELNVMQNAQDLRQEILNEENDERAANNPVFNEERENVKKAMKILDDAGLPFVLFFESKAHIFETGDPDDTTFIQYNNWGTQSQKIKDKKSRCKVISTWWYKFAWSVMHYLDGLGHPKNPPNHNAINYMVRVNNTGFNKYKEQEGID